MVELKSGRLTFTADRITLESRLDISEDEMPDSLKTVSYRLSQEAMKNIAKHSKASLVGLSLRKEGERIQLTVRDNGQWADSNKIVKGFGLTTMRERADLSGGVFTIDSRPGEGTIVRASWPWQ